MNIFLVKMATEWLMSKDFHNNYDNREKRHADAVDKVTRQPQSNISTSTVTMKTICQR